MIYSLFVINRAGGLIYQKNIAKNVPRLTQNDYLHLASTFHGMQLIVAELSPENIKYSGGMEKMETRSFVLHAYHSMAGVQFFVIAKPKTEKLPEFLREIYSTYADYVMKNPFYELDMPIKCELWEIHLAALISKYSKMGTSY